MRLIKTVILVLLLLIFYYAYLTLTDRENGTTLSRYILGLEYMSEQEAIVQADDFFKDLRNQLSTYKKKEIEIDQIEVVKQIYFINKSIWHILTKAHDDSDSSTPVLIIQYNVKTSESEVLLGLNLKISA